MPVPVIALVAISPEGHLNYTLQNVRAAVYVVADMSLAVAGVLEAGVGFDTVKWPTSIA